MALLVLILLATKRVLYKIDFIALLLVLEEGVGKVFCFNKHTIKLFSSAMEPILQKVIAYVGHPVLKKHSFPLTSTMNPNKS